MGSASFPELLVRHCFARFPVKTQTGANSTGKIQTDERGDWFRRWFVWEACTQGVVEIPHSYYTQS